MEKSGLVIYVMTLAIFTEMLNFNGQQLVSSIPYCTKKFSIQDLVTFTKEILNGKLHFLCSANSADKLESSCSTS